MNEETLVIDGVRVPVYAVTTLVVGSGAAGLNAAIALHEQGQQDVAIVTEAWGGGTSANAGSDKQTYYKLSLAGEVPDSPRQMAEDLFAGRCMHGDIALCEAQLSAQAFHRLVQFGVPFPHDEYGGYVGYRTDHSPRPRATSAGPLTSRLMVDALAGQVKARDIRVFDRHQVVALLTEGGGGERHIAGAIALALPAPGDAAARFVVFNAPNVVLATGGPGELYADSVYPRGQAGSIGIALEAGAIAQNLTESQYGLASIGFRWNLSGSYQQCVPRYVSTDADGGDEREFLGDGFPDLATLATAVFRKGYEWPFDPRRLAAFGSSLVDMLVYRERVLRRRRVFLDFTRNPGDGASGVAFSLDLLAPDARQYLRNCGSTAGTPIGRLAQMNQPAIELYGSHGIDLARDRLEIAVCAQHNNGGLRGNRWWESNLRGLFPVGEVNGSHGVYRPGGAALNAGQVGSLRAAMFIARRRNTPPPDPATFCRTCEQQVRTTIGYAARALSPKGDGLPVEAVRTAVQQRMSRHGAHVRVPSDVRPAVREARALCQTVVANPVARDVSELPALFTNRGLALAHLAYLEAIDEYLARGGQSRGSYVVAATPATIEATQVALNEPGAFVDEHVLEIALDEQLGVRKQWVEVRPIPTPNAWFESVWKAYRDDEVIR